MSRGGRIFLLSCSRFFHRVEKKRASGATSGTAVRPFCVMDEAKCGRRRCRGESYTRQCVTGSPFLRTARQVTRTEKRGPYIPTTPTTSTDSLSEQQKAKADSSLTASRVAGRVRLHYRDSLSLRWRGYIHIRHRHLSRYSAF